jgi:hypothetical protein
LLVATVDDSAVLRAEGDHVARQHRGGPVQRVFEHQVGPVHAVAVPAQLAEQGDAATRVAVGRVGGEGRVVVQTAARKASCCGVSGVDAVTAVTERTVQGVPTASGDSSTASPTTAGRKLFRLAVAPVLDIASSTLAPDSTREACSTSTRSMP